MKVMVNKNPVSKTLAVILTVIILLACGVSTPNDTGTGVEIDLTAIALDVAGTLTTMPLLPTPSATATLTQIPTVTLKPTSTSTSTQIPADTATPMATMPDAGLPTETQADVPAEATETQQAPVDGEPGGTGGDTSDPTPAAESTQDPVDAKIMTANILALEDIVQNDELVPRLDKAIARLNTSGRIANVYDASGYFLEFLWDGTPWDLVIVSIENRRDTRLGFWPDIKDFIDGGGAAIIELYYLNEISIGTVTPLLDGCGILVQDNWDRDSEQPYEKFVISAYDPFHPIFNTPNTIDMPLKPSFYWDGDVGDVIKLVGGAPGQILGGTYPADPMRSGLITSCYGGRLILQTFSTHDYPKDTTIDLWENYMRYTLKNRYEALP